MAEQKATELTPQQKSRSLRITHKKSIKKNVLVSPYNEQWEKFSKEYVDILLGKIKTEMVKHNVGIERMNKLTRKQIKIAKKEGTYSETDGEKIRKFHLVFGVNAITRELEKNCLRLVVICRSMPKLLSQNLLQLCVSRECPGICVADLRQITMDIFNFPSWAFGFKKQQESGLFDDLIQEIVSCLPQLHLDSLSLPAIVATDHEEDSEEDTIGDNDSDKITSIKQQTDSDYRHLYTYKKNTIDDNSDFIGFENYSSSEEITLSEISEYKRKSHFEEKDHEVKECIFLKKAKAKTLDQTVKKKTSSKRYKKMAVASQMKKKWKRSTIE